MPVPLAVPCCIPDRQGPFPALVFLGGSLILTLSFLGPAWKVLTARSPVCPTDRVLDITVSSNLRCLFTPPTPTQTSSSLPPGYCTLGVQNRTPQNVPVWHVNYFDLKAVKTLQAHKKLSPVL